MGSWLCSQFCFTSFHFKKETVAQKLMYYCCERIWWNKNKSWHSLSKNDYLFLSEKLRSFFVMISWCYNVLPKSLTRVLLVNTKAIENRVSGWQTRSSIKKYHLKKAWITYIHPWNSVTGERFIFQKWYKCKFKQHRSRSCQTRKAPEKNLLEIVVQFSRITYWLLNYNINYYVINYPEYHQKNDI